MLSTFHSIKKMAKYSQDHYTLSDQDVKQVQAILLEMMDDVHNLCQKYGLCYMMSGGCAIGAVRHQGFIPWDDDIDICMPRQDYERLPKLLLETFPDKYQVQELYGHKDYDLNFTKIRLNGTKFVELTDTEPQIAGIFIDVFPIENVYDNVILRFFQRFYSDGLQFICSCVRIKEKKEKFLHYTQGNVKLKLMLWVKSAMGSFFSFFSFRHWLLLTEYYLKHCDETNSYWISIPTGRNHFDGERYPRDWFFAPVLKEFAGRQYYFPAKVENYLKQLYGDYMTIPKKEERESHTVMAFDLGIYRDFRGDD